MDPTPAIRFESDPLLLKLATKGSIIQRQNLTQFVHVYGKAVAEKGLREVDKLRPESRCRSNAPFTPQLLKDPQGLAKSVPISAEGFKFNSIPRCDLKSLFQFLSFSCSFKKLKIGALVDR